MILFFAVIAASLPVHAACVTSAGRQAAVRFWGYRMAPTVTSQIPLQGTMAVQHNYIGGKLDYIAYLQDSISESLMHIHDALQMAACLYSIYYELSEVISNTAELAHSIDICPTGIFATIISGGRNKIWKETYENIMYISGDIYDIVASGKKNRMTGADRYDKVMEVQRRLRVFNHQLVTLSGMVRYTSLVDVWNEAIMKSQIGRRHDPVDLALQSLKLATLRVREDYAKYRYTTYEGFNNGKSLDGWTLPLRGR